MNNDIPVYFIEKDGKKCPDINYLCNLIFTETIDETTKDVTGIAVHEGPELINPKNLANMLKSETNARVIVSINGSMDIAWCGKGDNGIAKTIQILEDATNNKQDSWSALKAEIEK